MSRAERKSIWDSSLRTREEARYGDTCTGNLWCLNRSIIHYVCLIRSRYYDSLGMKLWARVLRSLPHGATFWWWWCGTGAHSITHVNQYLRKMITNSSKCAMEDIEPVCCDGDRATSFWVESKTFWKKVPLKPRLCWREDLLEAGDQSRPRKQKMQRSQGREGFDISEAQGESQGGFCTVNQRDSVRRWPQRGTTPGTLLLWFFFIMAVSFIHCSAGDSKSEGPSSALRS